MAVANATILYQNWTHWKVFSTGAARMVCAVVVSDSRWAEHEVLQWMTNALTRKSVADRNGGVGPQGTQPSLRDRFTSGGPTPPLRDKASNRIVLKVISATGQEGPLLANGRRDARCVPRMVNGFKAPQLPWLVKRATA